MACPSVRRIRSVRVSSAVEREGPVTALDESPRNVSVGTGGTKGGNVATLSAPNWDFMVSITLSGVVAGIRYRWYECDGASMRTPVWKGLTLPGSGLVPVRGNVNVGTPLAV